MLISFCLPMEFLVFFNDAFSLLGNFFNNIERFFPLFVPIFVLRFPNVFHWRELVIGDEKGVKK